MNQHDDDSLNAPLANADRALLRSQLEAQVRALGGYVPETTRKDVSDVELAFLQRVIDWEKGPSSTHREWLSRRGFAFARPEELQGPALERELWRLIEALAVARVFLYQTDHLSDEQLYAKLWHEVLAADAPDLTRTADDASHWDFADASGNAEIWLTYHASEGERQDWKDLFPDVVLPPRQRALFSRDHHLPVRD